MIKFFEYCCIISEWRFKNSTENLCKFSLITKGLIIRQALPCSTLVYTVVAALCDPNFDHINLTFCTDLLTGVVTLSVITLSGFYFTFWKYVIKMPSFVVNECQQISHISFLVFSLFLPKLFFITFFCWNLSWKCKLFSASSAKALSADASFYN